MNSHIATNYVHTRKPASIFLTNSVFFHGLPSNFASIQRTHCFLTVTMTRAIAFSKRQFLQLGLESFGDWKWATYKHHCNVERFRGYFGVTPRTCARIWHELRSSSDGRIRLQKNADPKHLLLAIRFVWRYEVETEAGQRFGIRSPKTVRKWAKDYAHRISLLLPKFTAKWSDAYVGLRFFFTVDGTHCPIHEPKPFDTKWSSHKFGGSPGVNYEIALRLDKPELLWLFGPNPAGRNDITTFKEDGFLDALKQFEANHGVEVRGIGDKGYVGCKEFLSTRNDLDPEELAEFKNRALARQETFNNKLKQFKCLTEVFRQHDIPFHKTCFETVTVLTLVQIQNGSLSLFDPYP